MANNSWHDNGVSNFADVKGLSRDRPWLFSTNRKLRHLQGISLRNLSLSTQISRPHGKTTDDESLPYSFTSPSKLLAQRENLKLEHSKSSSDLRVPQGQDGGKGETRDTSMDTAAVSRPSIKATRRRSTLNWASASPTLRQKKLEDATDARMADTWFSLHCPGVEEPVYISEIVEKAMNPSFRFFDMSAYGPYITRQNELSIKFWTRTQNMEGYILLLELQLHLGSLQFIGKTLETFHHPLPQNCVVLHLLDGIYTSFTDLPLADTPTLPPSLLPKSSIQNVQPTSSFDALMRLSNLDDCIQDALVTREKLTSQINSILSNNDEAYNIIASVSESQESLASSHRALAQARKGVEAAKARRGELQASLKARHFAMETGKSAQKKVASHLSSAKETMSTSTDLLYSTGVSLQGQVRRICEDLSSIYPIEPIEGKTLAFTIRGLYLPNANFFSSANSGSEEATAAALGMVAHIIHLLSYYLSSALPYPIFPCGSTSSIHDPISSTLPSRRPVLEPGDETLPRPPDPARIFPLYQKGSVQYRFEYGVFLLNTDLDLLMSKRGLRMVDIRHTLGNLKYLLFVLTSGRGDIPGRKMGGVRALTADTLQEKLDTDEEKDDSADAAGNDNGGRTRTSETHDKGKGKEKPENGSLVGRHPTSRTLALREGFE